MTKIIKEYQTVDGYDVLVELDTKQQQVFHFSKGKPDDVQKEIAVHVEKLLAFIATKETTAVDAKVEDAIKVPPGQAKKLGDAMNDVEAYVLKVAPEWRKLQRRQREALLDSNPILAQLIRLAEQFKGE